MLAPVGEAHPLSQLDKARIKVGTIIPKTVTNTIFSTIASKMGIRKWITPKESLLFFRIPVWILGLNGHWTKGFKPLHAAVVQLWRSNGSEMTVKYLAEVTRAVVCWGGNEKFRTSKGAPYISITGRGIPKIIPPYLRYYMIQMKTCSSEEGKVIYRAVLTVLSIFRVIGCYPKVKLGTITQPFTGVTLELPEWEIKKVIDLFKVPIKITKLPNPMTIVESAGPNYAKATWGSPLDAIALTQHLPIWEAWARYCLHMGYTRILLWQVVIGLVGFLLSPIMLLLKCYPSTIGRLVELPEARGKVRIIAITDWWTQLVFKPIHEAMFKTLKSIPQDGTFDQVRPLRELIARVRLMDSQILYSFDLSAATDRLPIDLQVQILNLCGIRGDLWKLILARPWSYNKENVYYSVGQPMGCYSSWSSLAITHHVIVQIAAQRNGYKGWFPDYAVLGDDIVIANDGVAQNYLQIMENLGVEINMAKSHRGQIAEFAKRYYSLTLDELTPLGAGNILGAVRNYRFILSLLVEMREKAFGFPFMQLENAIKLVPSIRRDVKSKSLAKLHFVALGPLGLSGSRNQLSGQALERWIRSLTPIAYSDMGNIIYNLYRREYTRETSIALQTYRKEMKYFHLYWSRYLILEENNRFATFGPRKDSLAHPLNTAIDMLTQKGTLWTIALTDVLRFAMGASLLRMSPAYYAYACRADPHDELWLLANDLPWNFTQVPEDLALIFKEMLAGPKVTGGSLEGWSERQVVEMDYHAMFARLTERLEPYLEDWFTETEPSSLELHAFANSPMYQEMLEMQRQAEARIAELEKRSMPSSEDEEITGSPEDLELMLEEGWEILE